MGKVIHIVPGGTGVPAEPDWAVLYPDDDRQECAQQYWHEIVSAMIADGLNARASAHQIYRMVIFRIEFDAAHLDVAQHGRILKARRTGVPMTNPAWTSMRQAAKILQQHERALGLSPRKRGTHAPNHLYPPRNKP